MVKLCRNDNKTVITFLSLRTVKLLRQIEKKKGSEKHRRLMCQRICYTKDILLTHA